MLSHIHIVLVETSHPGNIGAVARAMKNMSLERLVLVAPKVFPSADATARASGADDILHKATVVATLAEGLAACDLVIGTSTRSRSLAWPVMDARQCGESIVSEYAGRNVAIVFGREHSGLTNKELAQCHYQVQIPTADEFSSLNIAAAVQVLAYELFMAASYKPASPLVLDDDYATAEEMEQFYQHLEQVLIAIDFLNPQQPKQLMRRLRRLYNRVHIDRNEINILRGILTAVQRSQRE